MLSKRDFLNDIISIGTASAAPAKQQAGTARACQRKVGWFQAAGRLGTRRCDDPSQF
jgi:hypothetical protein